jgi:rhomboid protease GluP
LFHDAGIEGGELRNSEEFTQYEVDAMKNMNLEKDQKRGCSEKIETGAYRPFLTYILMIIQVAVFFWLETHGGSTNTTTLIKYGAKFNPSIYEGEWWRFFTPVFLHIGYMHLAMNTLALYYIGIAVESIYGNARFLFIYLFAGFTGCIASFLFSSTISAGASGAIFGCLGALLYISTIKPKASFRTMGVKVLVVLAIILAMGFTTTGIDNAGHLGGLAGGFLAAGIVFLPKIKKPKRQFLFLIMATLIVWSSITYGFSPSIKARDVSSNLILAQNDLKNHQYKHAYHTLKNIAKKSKNPSAQVYFLLSFSEIKQEMLPEAKLHLQQATKLEPEFDEAYYNLALIYMEENNYDLALKNAEKAVQLKPNQKEYQNLAEEINQHFKPSNGG